MKMIKAKIIAINLVVFLVIYVLADIICGLFLIPYNYNAFRVKHPYYHHGLMPNINQYAAWGKHLYRFTTNSLGMRDNDVRVIKQKSDKKRILIMGDSHSEGVGVDYNSTFSGILHLNTENMPVEILNYSAVSYSPKIHFLKADYLINKNRYEVDKIWVFIDISDMQNEIAYEGFEPKESTRSYLSIIKTKKIFEKHSFTYYAIKSMHEKNKINDFVRKMYDFDPSKAKLLQKNTVELYEDFFRDFDDDDMLRSPEFHGVGEWYYKQETKMLAQKGLDLGKKNILKLDSLCKANDIELTLSVHPWHSQILKQNPVDSYVLNWQSFCDSNKIGFINLFPLFINEENPHSVIQKYYIPNDNHWNEEGHSKVADYLMNIINKENV